MATGWMEGRECAVSPRSKSRTSRRWCHPAKAFTITPIAISTVPNHGDSPYDCGDRLCWAAQSCCSKSPKRATTKPNPIKARPVRIHASIVRSAARGVGASVGVCQTAEGNLSFVTASPVDSRLDPRIIRCGPKAADCLNVQRITMQMLRR